MAKQEINELARRQIRSAAQQALVKAGVLGIVPTPLSAVSRICGVVDTLDVSDLPSDLVARRPSALKRVLGAVFYRERLVFVDRSLSSARARFTEAHELSHKIIPWHEALYRFDDNDRLFGPTKRKIDLEADAGAAELLFQGDLFVSRALEYRVSITAPMALAPEFGASIHASVRHYARFHPDAIAVLVGGRFPRMNGTVPVYSVDASPSFSARFGLAESLFLDGLPASAEHSDPLGAVVEEARTEFEVTASRVVVLDLNGEPHVFVAEAFDNQRNVFLMLTEDKAAGAHGRRVRIGVG
jgi:hypothetical protein